jgi:hypothetical protein
MLADAAALGCAPSVARLTKTPSSKVEAAPTAAIALRHALISLPLAVLRKVATGIAASNPS